ncbi:MAG: zf-HC2 domain-containing protein [Actinobacteria bacterium]|nr:MAG: zf-HC2 domain-containing protein [Actinomycetota bacterium]
MECLKAQQMLSEAIDSAVPEDELAEARAHCVGCEECTRFARSLERISSLPTPVAPDALVSRLVALGAQEAAVLRTAPAGSPEDGVAPDGHAAAPVRLMPAWWAPRLTAYAAVAAVLLVALVATGIGLGGVLSPREAVFETAEDTRARTDGAALSAAPAPGGTQEATKALSDTLIAPPYVVIDGLVYTPTGPRTVDAATLVTATPVLTSLHAASDPITLPAYRISTSNDTAVLQLTDGTYLGFSAVTREFGGRAFVLTSGSLLTSYGQWPTLPARFQQPTAPDGSPTFSFFGKDDSGTLIYIPTGGQATDGFAVAPGSGPQDPAAGNPNWTWWQRL